MFARAAAIVAVVVASILVARSYLEFTGEGSLGLMRALPAIIAGGLIALAILGTKAVLTSHLDSLNDNDRNRLDQVFSIDFRALALFRLLLGILLACLAIQKIRSIPLEGEYLPGQLQWWLILLAALPLIVGRFVLAAALVGWLLLYAWVHAAFHQRGGTSIDVYLILIGLFWTLFLPVDARLSLGRPAGVLPAPRWLSIAGAGLLLQVFILYFSAGITKDLGQWLIRGDALEHLMHTQFTSPLGRSLTAYPWLLALGSRLAIGFELAAPFLLFVPGRRLPVIRSVLVAGYLAFHLGMVLVLDLGLVPFSCMIYWVLFMPTAVWDVIWPAAVEKAESALDASGTRKALAAGCLATMFVSFALSIVVVDREGPLASIRDHIPKMGLYQNWRMFDSPLVLREKHAKALEQERAAGARPK